MNLKGIILIGLTLSQFSSFSQNYNVSGEDRNQTIELTNQGIDAIKENKTDEAFTLLTKAISIDSTFRPSFINLYKVFVQKKDYSEQVITYLNKGKRIFKEDDELSFYLGEIYRVNSNIKKAIQEYSTAIKYSKKNGEDFSLVSSYYVNRGNCYMRTNLVDSALLDYNYALKLNPNLPNVLLNRGICLFKKGNTNEACEDWKKSSTLGSAQAKEYLEKNCNK